jgi:hypothetical protein
MAFIKNQSTSSSSSTRSGTKKSPKGKCASGQMVLERETGLEPDPGLIDQTKTRRWLAPFSSVIQPG